MEAERGEARDDWVDSLRRCPLFHGVERRDLERLLAAAGRAVRTCRKGSLIAFRGDPYGKLLVILSGSLSADFQDYRGKSMKVETLRAHEAVATAVLFAPDNLLPVTLTAAEDTRLLEIPRPAVLALMRQSGRFLENYLASNGAKLTLLAEKLYLQRFATIRRRIAGYLLDQADKQGTDSPRLAVTKEALAEIFGVTRPSLSRSFAQLRREGILQPEGRTVHILKRPALEALAEGE